MVDQDAWNDAMAKARQLRQVQRDLPGMLASVQQAQEQQAARDRAAVQARQDELTGKLAALSAHARQIEETTSQRIRAATATIMNEAKKANADLRSETRHQIEQQEQRFNTALSSERAERQHDVHKLQREIDRDRATRADLLATARAVVADARVLYDAIDSNLPHERFAPGRLSRLGRDLALAEANIAAGAAEAALSHGQTLYLNLGDLRADVELEDAKWRAAPLTAVTRVAGLGEQISGSERSDVVDDETGNSAELDVDFWSEGELSKIGTLAGRLSARLS